MGRYIDIEPKSDDACLPYSLPEEDYPTEDELRREYWPFLEEPIKRYRL